MKSWALWLLIVLAFSAPCQSEVPAPWRPSQTDAMMQCVVDRSTPPDLPIDRAAGPPLTKTTGDVIDDQFITHWVTTTGTMPGLVDDDLIGETTFEGRCSGGAIAGTSGAPSTSPVYSSAQSVETTYWDAFSYSDFTFHTDNQNRYFYTWVKSHGDQEVDAVIGASDYFKLWINGSLVASRTSGGPRPYTEDEYRFMTTLPDGWNLLLVKQSFPQLGPPDDPDHNNRVKDFSLRFVDRVGEPIHLVAALDPMCDYLDRIGKQSKALVPSIAHLSGVGGSQWRTDVLLHNGTHMTWLFVLRYFREGNSSGTPDAVAEGELAPFGTANFEDALRHTGLFGVAVDQKGYFEVLHSDATYITEGGWLKTKVYNQGAAGTFGMNVPPVGYFHTTRYPRSFAGLRNGDFRSNFGMVPWDNAGASVRVRLTLVGPDLGGPLVREFGPYEGMWQLNDVFAEMGAGGVNTATATLYVEFLDNPSDTRWIAYASVNDGDPIGTSDPIFFRHGLLGITPPALE